MDLKNNKFVVNLQKQAEENPILALGVAAGCAQALSKLLNANAARSNSKTYAKEVDRRVRKSK